MHPMSGREDARCLTGHGLDQGEVDLGKGEG
jgi:hypothetical protein